MHDKQNFFRGGGDADGTNALGLRVPAGAPGGPIGLTGGQPRHVTLQTVIFPQWELGVI